MKLPKQRHIDKGQLGGILHIFTRSNIPIVPINFIGTASLCYDQFLKPYCSIPTGIIVILIGAVTWWIFDYTMLYPSQVQFGNHQGYAHNSPIKSDFEELNNRLDKNEKMLKKIEEMLKK